jgi:hypothetical protein
VVCGVALCLLGSLGVCPRLTLMVRVPPALNGCSKDVETEKGT